MTSATQVALQPEFRCPLFDGLDKAALREVLGAARVQRVRARQVLFNAGDPASQLAVLVAGAGQTYALTDEGQRVIIFGIGVGGIAGGSALIKNRSIYLVTTEITEDGEALVWTRDTIRALAQRFPVIIDNALSVAGEFIRTLLERRIAMASQTAEGQLAQVLLEMSESVGRKHARGVELRVTNEHLADMAHISQFTTSRILSEWARRGAITRSRGRVVVLSKDLPPDPA